MHLNTKFKKKWKKKQLHKKEKIKSFFKKLIK